jgi:hypothetical protein
LSAALEKIILRALEREPAKRFLTAAQMEDELDRFLASSDVNPGLAPRRAS